MIRRKSVLVGHRGAGQYVCTDLRTGITTKGTIPADKPVTTIRKKILVESVRVADLKVGIRKKLGVAKSLVGHVMFECPRCKADAVMATPGDRYQAKCSKCSHTTPAQKDEHLAATTWNVTP